jgi:biopolymer transport protein ExbB
VFSRHHFNRDLKGRAWGFRRLAALFVMTAAFGWTLAASSWSGLAGIPGGEGGVAHAQAAPADAPAPAPGSAAAPSAPKKNALAFIADGGWIGYVILVCSLIGFSFAITFAFQFRRDALVPPEVLGQVEQSFEEENYEEAYAVCEGNPSLFSTILAAGLAKLDKGWEEIENSMADAIDTESNKLNQKVGWLSLISAIAPMLGLFGTVAGMIATFDVIAGSNTTPKPAQLADGISVALVTTYLGLVVAIPMVVLFVIFRNRVITSLGEITALTAELMERFKTK